METLEKLAVPLAEAAAARGMEVDDLVSELVAHVDAYAHEIASDRVIRAQLSRVQDARTAAVAAEASWRSAVVEAAALGASRRQIADAAGITHQGVTRIVRTATSDR